MRILVTGGAGYIGSHTLLQLLRQRHEVAVIDNYSNSSPEALGRVKQLANTDFDTHQCDIRDTSVIDSIFRNFLPDAVVHFAGLKAVGESKWKPLDYYSNNVCGSVEILNAMQRNGCKRLVFSSSATVYGRSDVLPNSEDHPLSTLNPYGRTKYFVEEIIRDWIASVQDASAVLLRYYNPAGADPSGRIGEDPNGVPNNLVPYLAQVGLGRISYLSIYGDDYDTRDGTGERDYIHVEDLALAHLAALDYAKRTTGCEAINIGTGNGATVMEMRAAFEKACGREIPYKVVPRREGDAARSIAAVAKAERLLGWRARYDIHDMCQSTWHWQSTNPHGFTK
jgi:UDP-glucose 4-epimerase